MLTAQGPNPAWIWLSKNGASKCHSKWPKRWNGREKGVLPPPKKVYTLHAPCMRATPPPPPPLAASSLHSGPPLMSGLLHPLFHRFRAPPDNPQRGPCTHTLGGFCYLSWGAAGVSEKGHSALTGEG